MTTVHIHSNHYTTVETHRNLNTTVGTVKSVLLQKQLCYYKPKMLGYINNPDYEFRLLGYRLCWFDPPSLWRQ